MQSHISRKLDIKHYPLILKIVCILVLLPILAAPLVFYSTIFFFDHPSSEGEAFLWFLVVNSYSVILFGICWASIWIYTRTRKTAFATFPFFLYLALIFAGYWYITDGPVDKESVSANDYRLFRDTPCEELAKYVNRQDVEKINQLLDISPELLNYKESKYNQTVFLYAIYDDKFKSVEVLLKKGADPNQVNHYISSYYHNQSFINCPLSSVCEKNVSEDKKIKYVRLLLDYGADINTACVKGYIGENKWNSPSTPLSIASQDGDIKLVRFLLDNGADPNYQYEELDPPPLQTALIFNNFEIAEELLRHGADPDLRFYEHNTSVREELIEGINTPNPCVDTDKDVSARRGLLDLIQKSDSIKRVAK